MDDFLSPEINYGKLSFLGFDEKERNHELKHYQLSIIQLSIKKILRYLCRHALRFNRKYQ
jgi:hypothetical protein